MTARGDDRRDQPTTDVRRAGGHWFDRLAVSATDGPRMTRRASLERAAVAVLAAGPLAALAARATAAGVEGPRAAGDACGGCHAGARQSFVQRQVACFSGVNRRGSQRHAPCTLLTEGGCFFVIAASAVSDKAQCQASSACQEEGNPPGSPPPPQLQSPATDLCSACTEVGGKCCYGSDPTAPCACIPPDRNCKDFC